MQRYLYIMNSDYKVHDIEKNNVLTIMYDVCKIFPIKIQDGILHLLNGNSILLT